jgi:hypothetical protein
MAKIHDLSFKGRGNVNGYVSAIFSDLTDKMKLSDKRLKQINSIITPILKFIPVSEKPIFLLGHDRSGTTWIGKCLSFASNTIYFHEPLNPHCSQLGDMSGWNRYLEKEDSDPLYETVFDNACRATSIRILKQEDLLKRIRLSCRVLIKETGGMLCSEWYKQRYDANILFVIRHPIPVILSNLKMNGGRDGLKWLTSVLSQEKLVNVHLEPYREKILEKLDEADPVTCFALNYGARYRIIANQIKNDSSLKILFYENACSDPIGTMESAYVYLKLPFSDQIKNKILQTTLKNDGKFFGSNRKSEMMKYAWKSSIDLETLKKIKTCIDIFDLPFYVSDKDWSLTP